MAYRRGRGRRARKRKRGRSGFFRGLAILALVTLALKLFLQSPAALSLEETIAQAAGEGSLAAAALRFELGDYTEASAEETDGDGSGPWGNESFVVQIDDPRDTGEITPEDDAGADAAQETEDAGVTAAEETGEKSALIYDAGLLGITNHTSMEIDLGQYLAKDLDLTLSDEGPSVLIIHTHGSEAYTSTAENCYAASDPYRTEDANYSVIRVGNVLEEALEDAGVEVIHDTALYDYPSYTGCYSRALDAIEGYLEKYPTISVVLDIHRDSVQTAEGDEYSTYATINGEQCAQVMLVVGTGEGGLYHPNWEKNFRLALELQTVMANRYPGLARNIDLRTERFNEHATNGSLLVEIGYSGNTLEEALAAADCFSQCLTETLLESS